MAGASTTVLGTFALAAILVVAPWLWRNVTYQAVAVVHEAGHALALLTTGNWIGSIGVAARAGGGKTSSAGPLFWPAKVLFFFAGYAAPPLIGFVLALGVDRGWQPSAVLVALLLVLGASVAFHDDWPTLLILAASAAVVAVFYLQAGRAAQVGLLVFVAWLLLIAGFWNTLQVAGDGTSVDHRQLAESTSIPGAVWILSHVLIGLACLVAGARLLLS